MMALWGNDQASVHNESEEASRPPDRMPKPGELHLVSGGHQKVLDDRMWPQSQRGVLHSLRSKMANSFKRVLKFIGRVIIAVIMTLVALLALVVVSLDRLAFSDEDKE